MCLYREVEAIQSSLATMVPRPALAATFEVMQWLCEKSPADMLDRDNCSPTGKDKFAPCDLLYRPWHRILVGPRRSFALKPIRVAEAARESRMPRQKVNGKMRSPISVVGAPGCPLGSASNADGILSTRHTPPTPRISTLVEQAPRPEMGWRISAI